ncbi:hypothetical protein HPB50_023436 [Hyalomma asiaticum]|uniref:Uncharacterized protein n=1 Tax=Hyalomma asiaticum TaxID=266040 RepID=A0ACB7TN35_HYAAI|nr:hypothetical protein HPB50_023436 [Hyalomma asiaticum]
MAALFFTASVMRSGVMLREVFPCSPFRCRARIAMLRVAARSLSSSLGQRGLRREMCVITMHACAFDRTARVAPLVFQVNVTHHPDGGRCPLTTGCVRLPDGSAAQPLV